MIGGGVRRSLARLAWAALPLFVGLVGLVGLVHRPELLYSRFKSGSIASLALVALTSRSFVVDRDGAPEGLPAS